MLACRAAGGLWSAAIVRASYPGGYAGPIHSTLRGFLELTLPPILRITRAAMESEWCSGLTAERHHHFALGSPFRRLRVSPAEKLSKWKEENSARAFIKEQKGRSDVPAIHLSLDRPASHVYNTSGVSSTFSNSWEEVTSSLATTSASLEGSSAATSA